MSRSDWFVSFSGQKGERVKCFIIIFIINVTNVYIFITATSFVSHFSVGLEKHLFPLANDGSFIFVTAAFILYDRLFLKSLTDRRMLKARQLPSGLTPWTFRSQPHFSSSPLLQALVTEYATLAAEMA